MNKKAMKFIKYKKLAKLLISVLFIVIGIYFYNLAENISFRQFDPGTGAIFEGNPFEKQKNNDMRDALENSGVIISLIGVSGLFAYLLGYFKSKKIKKTVKK